MNCQVLLIQCLLLFMPLLKLQPLVNMQHKTTTWWPCLLVYAMHKLVCSSGVLTSSRFNTNFPFAFIVGLNVMQLLCNVFTCCPSKLMGFVCCYRDVDLDIDLSLINWYKQNMMQEKGAWGNSEVVSSHSLKSRVTLIPLLPVLSTQSAAHVEENTLQLRKQL